MHSRRVTAAQMKPELCWTRNATEAGDAFSAARRRYPSGPPVGPGASMGLPAARSERLCWTRVIETVISVDLHSVAASGRRKGRRLCHCRSNARIPSVTRIATFQD